MAAARETFIFHELTQAEGYDLLKKNNKGWLVRKSSTSAGIAIDFRFTPHNSTGLKYSSARRYNPSLSQASIDSLIAYIKKEFNIVLDESIRLHPKQHEQYVVPANTTATRSALWAPDAKAMLVVGDTVSDTSSGYAGGGGAAAAAASDAFRCPPLTPRQCTDKTRAVMAALRDLSLFRVDVDAAGAVSGSDDDLIEDMFADLRIDLKPERKSASHKK